MKGLAITAIHCVPVRFLLLRNNCPNGMYFKNKFAMMTWFKNDPVLLQYDINGNGRTERNEKKLNYGNKKKIKE